MGKHKSVFGEAVSEMKHFLLGAGLVLALVTVVPALAQMGPAPGGDMGGGGAPSGGDMGSQFQPPPTGQETGGLFQPPAGVQMVDPSKFGGSLGGKDVVPMPGFKPGENDAGGLDGVPMPGFKPTERNTSRGSSSKFGSSRRGGSQGGQGKSFGRGQGLGKGLETAPGQTGNFPEGGEEDVPMPGFSRTGEDSSTSGASRQRRNVGSSRAQEKALETVPTDIDESQFEKKSFKPVLFKKSEQKQTLFRKTAPKKPKFDVNELTFDVDQGINDLQKSRKAFEKKLKKVKNKKDALNVVRSVKATFGATYEDDETGETKYELCDKAELPELPLEVDVEEFDCDEFVSGAVEALDEAIRNRDYKTGLINANAAFKGFVDNLEAQKEAVAEGVNAANAEEDGSDDSDLFDPVEEE